MNEVGGNFLLSNSLQRILRAESDSMKIGSTILVVEDNETFRELLQEVMGEHGYRVVEATNGQEALEVMEKIPTQAAIVDLEMPVMNGLEFTKRVKEKSPEYPIILVTAYAAFHSPQEILAANVDAFLQKPISMDKLVKVIEQL
jgi:CheY-like chemotaxis protein